MKLNLSVFFYGFGIWGHAYKLHSHFKIRKEFIFLLLLLLFYGFWGNVTESYVFNTL